MVTCYAAHLGQVYRSIQGITLSGSIVCDYCAHPHLSPTDYWTHQPLFHIFTGNKPATCQVCAADVDNLAVHLHEEHGPHGPQREPRIPVGACVVVRRRKDNKFLMIQVGPASACNHATCRMLAAGLRRGPAVLACWPGRPNWGSGTYWSRHCLRRRR